MRRSVVTSSLVLAVIATLFLAAAVVPVCASEGRVRAGPLPEIGCEPPDFTLPTPDGRQMNIGVFRGKVILLTFCAGYTDTCCALVNALTPLLDRYESQGLVAPLIVSEVAPALARERCAGLSAALGERFPTLIDDGRHLKGSYQVRLLPTCFVIGRDFCIRDRVRGEAVFYTEEFRAALEALLAGEP